MGPDSLFYKFIYGLVHILINHMVNRDIKFQKLHEDMKLLLEKFLILPRCPYSLNTKYFKTSHRRK